MSVSYKLPNVRRIFVPDEGYVMVEADLKQADAQIVAWDAGDEPLKQIFREKKDLHSENAKVIFGPQVTRERRQKAKTGVHAVDYGCKARTLAGHLGITVHEADRFIHRWFGEHPAIHAWQQRIEMELMTRRCVENVYGYKRHYFDRVQELLPEALAWIGQSTTAITCNKGMMRIYKSLPHVQILLQGHDSVLSQAPISLIPRVYREIQECMLVTVPYEDPLVIPVDIKASEKSWGDVEEVEIGEASGELAKDIPQIHPPLGEPHPLPLLDGR